MTLSALRASPGEIVDVRPLGSELTTAQVVPLMKTSDLEVFRVVVPSGTTVPKHEFSREVIVHCLEGRARLVSPGEVHDLTRGSFSFTRLMNRFPFWDWKTLRCSSRPLSARPGTMWS